MPNMLNKKTQPIAKKAYELATHKSARMIAMNMVPIEPSRVTPVPGILRGGGGGRAGED